MIVLGILSFCLECVSVSGDLVGHVLSPSVSETAAESQVWASNSEE